MGWSAASHFSHASASFAGVARQAHPRECAPENGGWHGLAGWGWCFRGFPEAGAGLRAHDSANPVSDARSSVAVTNLCLAQLRSVSEISGTDLFPRLLAGEAGGAVVLGDGSSFQADQAG